MRNLGLWEAVMRKHKWCSTAFVVAVLLLASLAIGCAAPAPSSAPPTETPSATESPQQQDQPAEEEAAEEPPPTAPATKQALFVIYKRFEETEYGKPHAILEDAGIIVTVASSSLDTVTGHLGTQVEPDIALSDVHAADYDAIVFVGGYGYNKNDPEAIRVAQEAAAEGKVLAAICVAPITLAKAGVLEGKRATSSIPPSTLTEAGAIYTGALVERDGLIITANGPKAARLFGETIAAALEE
jgi:protease I